MSSSPINNKNLFSNHYLENQIKSTSEWGRDDHITAFEEIKRVYDREIAFVGNLSESQLEDRFFRAVFKTILPHYEVQGVTREKEFPDYAFFPDQASRDRALSYKDTGTFFKEAFAIGEVKRWDVELDRFGKDRQDRRRNPSFQIWLYLHDTEPRWGVLSNGHKWRLYQQNKPLDVYYEVDLASILEHGDVEGFRYFYYFFRKAAFLPDEKGEVFLDLVLKGSADYAQDIGDNLKENVYRAMKRISDGFFRWTENGLDPKSPETRELVQKNTMILLYRFLFLLYAEGRSLLDLRDDQYREFYSFDRIKKKVAERQDGPQKGRFPSTTTSLWGNLGDLFRLINSGNQDIGIPAYNGGLFNPEKHPLLEKWTIGDSYLAEAIDLLSRSEILDRKKGAKGSKGFVDYSSLEIRHLGSIYEGLLEYKLVVAEEDLVVSGGKDRRWITLSEYNRGKKQERSFEEFGEFDRARGGELHLTTDRGERKSTGSYYTPDYIVDYIVEKTVGAVVEERWKEALQSNRSLIETTLSVKVLDPAMGSGHFLVGAVEYLAGKLLQAAERDIEWGWVEDRGQFTTEWAKREVVSHCIYGVDLNDLAVELAKVSLWLITIAKDKPLSFLDHRLKQGNSLVGGMLFEIVHYPGGEKKTKDQATLPSFVSPIFIDLLISKIKKLEGIGDDTISEIREKEEILNNFKSSNEYIKAKAIANVHTAVYFGNGVKAKTYEGKVVDSSDNIYHGLFWAVEKEKEDEWKRKTKPGWFYRAQDMEKKRNFFHWQLEFPEIFFEAGAMKQNPGWDTIIGNPPYVRQEGLGEFKGYFEEKYRVYHGIADLYVYFFERGHQLLRPGGDFGFISSNKFMRSNYGKPLREFLRDGIHIKEIVDFGELPVFPEAATFPAIYLTEKCVFDGPTNYIQIQSLDFDSLDKFVSEKGLKISAKGFGGENWSLTSENETKIMRKMDGFSDSLEDYTKGEINYGLKSGLNEAFIIDEVTKNKLIIEDPRSEEVIKPILVGNDIRKYEINYNSIYLIYIPWHFPLNDDASIKGASEIAEESFSREYPAIYNYLSKFKDKLQKRNLAETGIRYEWYALQRFASDYYTDFDQPKIVYPDIGMSCRFALDDVGYFLDTTCFEIPIRDLYLLSILNSKLIFFYIRSLTPVIGDVNKGGRLRFKRIYLKQLPIRRISFSTPEDERHRLAEELKGLFAAGRFGEVLTRVDEYLPKNDAGEFISEMEKSDVVHDLLDHLAEEMTHMNKEKQEEIRDFLNWLEGDIGAKVEDLTNKTKVQSYYEYEFGDLLAVLKKNKRKLKEDYSTRKPQERVKLEFENSIATLKPLLSRIKETDDLIDQVVYKLYGLTEEEIVIVKGAT